MPRASFLPRFVWVASLFLIAGGPLIGCGTGSSGSSRGESPRPTPAHYRDFESADRLSAYLRSDALPLIGAHRGGATDALPENALATFAQSLTHGPVLLETDVRMTKDSVLVLMHDKTLDRTTTGRGPVPSRTLSDVRGLRLISGDADTTRHQVPTVAEALAWAEGRAVLQLDVKADVPRPLVASVLRRMSALDRALVITYTLEDAQWYHERLPDLLLSVTTETRTEAAAHVEQIEPSRLIAFTGVGTPPQGVVDYWSERNVPISVGAFGDLDRQAQQRGLVVYRDLFRQGVDIVATDETALASQAADTYPSASAAAATP